MLNINIHETFTKYTAKTCIIYHMQVCNIAVQ
jgi:hypothetical protein